MRAPFAGLAAILLLSLAPGARAQQLEPRAYANAPIGMSFLIAGYAQSSGGLSTDAAQPLQDAHLDIRTPFAAYAHAFDAWGKSARFDAIVAGGCLDGTAEAGGVPVSRDVCGLLDPAFRVSVNFYGAPATTLEDYPRYQQDLIAGASLQVQAPLGQYDPTRLVNLGSHRWAFRPEVGVSKAFDPLIVELALAATLYTTNHDFYGGKARQQDPVYNVQAHLIYAFTGGAWLALDANYYLGGQTKVNGLAQNDELGNSRLGMTLALPWDRQNSIKLYASHGVSVRYGDDFRIFGAAWQYRWGGGL